MTRGRRDHMTGGGGGGGGGGRSYDQEDFMTKGRRDHMTRGGSHDHCVATGADMCIWSRRGPTR